MRCYLMTNENHTSELPKRKTVRLKHYDYSSIGYYFVTICCFNRQPLFGYIENGEMHLNEFGKIAYQEWLNTFEKRRNLELDAFVIMPNHVHLIVNIKEKMTDNENVKRSFTNTHNDLGAIVRGYKGAVSSKLKNYIPHPIWQRNYHEHIIKNAKAYEQIWDYVTHNPLLWDKDCFISRDKCNYILYEL